MKKKKRLAKQREEMKKQRAAEYRRLAETSELEKENFAKNEVANNIVVEEEVNEPVVEETKVETHEEKIADRQKKIDSLSTYFDKRIDYNESYKNFNQMEKAARQRMELLKTREILTRIYAEDIKVEEIEKSNISKWQKTMLVIAYYDKNNRKLGIEKAKEAKKEYVESPNKLKVINAILENLKSKKAKVFSAEYYTRILDVTVDFELASKISEEKKAMEEKENTSPIIETKKELIGVKALEPKKEKVETKTVVIGGNGITTNRFTSKGSNQTINTTNNSNNVHEAKVLLIKEVFDEEITELKKYIYSLTMGEDTRKDAVKAWDNLEGLIDKPITDKSALDKLLKVLKRLEEIQYLKIDKEKVKKYSQ